MVKGDYFEIPVAVYVKVCEDIIKRIMRSKITEKEAASMVVQFPLNGSWEDNKCFYDLGFSEDIKIC